MGSETAKLAQSQAEYAILHYSKIVGWVTGVGHVWTAPAVQEESDYQRNAVAPITGGYDPAVFIRHEIGHCNGWPATHKGAR
jgi:hypothetical protein